MKYLKMLGLAAVAAMALMAFVGAGTASAGGILCSTQTTPCDSPWPVGTVLDFSLKSGTSANLTTTEGTTIDTCTEATVQGKLTKNSETVATGNNTAITWTKCTSPTTTTKLGKLRITNAGGYNGTVIADELIEVTIETTFFGHCLYGVEPGTVLGTVTEGIGTGVVFTANAVAKRLGTSGEKPCLAPETARWKAEYVLTSPSNTTFAVSP